ncbi:MAG: 1-acyl-sn-glycerol-3-phosphate acyltransferase [Myxococcota bacterium]
MAQRVTLDTLVERNREPVGPAIAAVAGLIAAVTRLPGRRVRFEVEGFDRVPRAPVLFATNHTHRHDWIAMRWVCHQRQRSLVNWVKPRSYDVQWRATFLDVTGNVPLASRGWILAADFAEVNGRPPGEQEYRTLRDHLDHGRQLPDTVPMVALQQRPRDLLGRAFDPARESWREAVEALFADMMAATLARTRSLLSGGLDLNIFPQGVFSTRLTKGHPGAVQAALALDLPVVPVGISGAPQSFVKDQPMGRPGGGTVTVRFGEPYRVRPIDGHTPFVPASERTHIEALHDRTAVLMDRVAELVDPEHGWAPDDADDGITGVARFL